jgi:hypothetical protein
MEGRPAGSGPGWSACPVEWLRTALRPGGTAEQATDDGDGGEGRPTERGGADPEVDRDPPLLGPVDVLQVEQQCELVDDQRETGAVGQCRDGVVPSLATVDRDPSGTGDHADPPHVVVQVLPPTLRFWNGPLPERMAWVTARTPANVRVKLSQDSRTDRSRGPMSCWYAFSTRVAALGVAGGGADPGRSVRRPPSWSCGRP